MLKEQHHYCCVDWGKISWSFVLVLVQSNQPEIRLLIWLEAADSSTDKAKQSLKDSKQKKVAASRFPDAASLPAGYVFSVLPLLSSSRWRDSPGVLAYVGKNL